MEGFQALLLLVSSGTNLNPDFSGYSSKPSPSIYSASDEDKFIHISNTSVLYTNWVFKSLAGEVSSFVPLLVHLGINLLELQTCRIILK